ADQRPEVLEDLVVGVAEGDRVGPVRPVPEAQRRRVGRDHVGLRVELVVADLELVPVVDVPVDPGQVALRRGLEVVALVGAGLVAEVGREEAAQLVEVALEDAGGVALDRLPAGVGLEQGARLGDAVRLVAGEEEELVPDDRAAEAGADVVELEGPRVERDVTGLLADEVLVPLLLVEGALEIVGLRHGYSVDAGVDEVAMTYGIGADVHLDLLVGVDRVRGDADPATRLGAGAETVRIVEV